MVSDNASVFKSTATWMKNVRKSERLQDHLARQDTGPDNLAFEQLEVLVIDVEKNLNNGPLTYLDSDGGEEQV